MIEFTHCPVCESQIPRNKVGHVQDNHRIKLLECAICKAVSASHKPHPEVLTTYYKEHFSKVYSLYNTPNMDVTFSGLSRFASHLEKMIPDSWLEELSQKEAISIIVFGGGNSALTVEFAKRLPSHLKIRITLIDFGDNIYKSDYSRISINKIKYIGEFTGSVDPIIASASLDACPRPKRNR